MFYNLAILKMKKIFILLTFLVSCSTFAFAQIYKIGDYYNDGKKEGVVFEVSEDGKHGKIVSMKQSAKELQWSSDATAQKYYTGADNWNDGLYNMNKIKSISGWEKKYPAFKWCVDMGEGWYLPAPLELVAIHNNAKKLNPKLVDKISFDDYCWYWTSLDDDKSSGETAGKIEMRFGDPNSINKSEVSYVRAVAAF